MKFIWMMWGILLNFILPIYLLLSSVVALVIAFVFPKRAQGFLQSWGKVVVKLCFLEVEVSGVENLPKGGAIFLFNHQSYLDIPVLHFALPTNFRFGAKIELFKFPVFGAAMRNFGVLPITRQNVRNVRNVYQQASSRVKGGESFMLAPEGTRSEVNGISEFKSGPFIFAIQSEADVVPVVIEGLGKIFPKSQPFPKLWQSRKVQVQILPAVSTVGVTVAQRHELKDRVRNQFVSTFNSLTVSKCDHDQSL